MGVDIKTKGSITLFCFTDFSSTTLDAWIEAGTQVLQQASATKKFEILAIWDFSLIGDGFQLSSQFKNAGLELLNIYPEIKGKIAIIIPDLEASAIFIKRIMQLFSRSKQSARIVKIFLDNDIAIEWLLE